MKASVFSVPISTPFDAQGQLLDEDGNLLSGYLRVTDADTPIPADTKPIRHVVMGEPGKPVLTEAISIATTGNPPWTLSQLVNYYPDIAPYILEKSFKIIVNGLETINRTKMIKPLPVGATLISQNIIPIIWAGDTDET